ncbi:MAG: hypothetical protein H0W39_06115 [Sphingomonas sp.]|nr:hypothetical protein [Sphingomonas sp.]
MSTTRAAIAANPRRFGRARRRVPESIEDKVRTLPEDLRLFAATFTAGFLFVSILIG